MYDYCRYIMSTNLCGYTSSFHNGVAFMNTYNRKKVIYYSTWVNEQSFHTQSFIGNFTIKEKNINSDVSENFIFNC